MSESIPSLQKAGSVKIVELKLISSTNVVWDLKEFLVELNLYEDIFSNNLYGDILLSDSRNLIDKVPLIGEEFINVEFVTPSFEEAGHFIKKTFRVFKISSRKIVRDNNTQLFVLHFASVELFYDMLLPLYKSFEGKIHDLVDQIYFDYLASNRNFNISGGDTSIDTNSNNTNLIVMNETSNDVKFVSPGWTPMKCINWLASKSIPKDGISKNYLFFETNRAFYFGSLEYLFKDAKENKNNIGTYSMSVSNVRENKSKNINREFFIVQSVDMIDTTDHVKNYTNGYLANRLITLDVFNKKYELVDYDYVEDYQNNYHTSGEGKNSQPVFTKDSPRNAATSISFYPVNPRLFQTSKTDYFKDNVSEKMKDIHGNRKSSLLGLTNIKLNIVVPGRTDVEAGRLLFFNFPALGAASEADKSKDFIDKNYSGYYLITAIHHRVTAQEHVMTMEIVKDSLTVEEQ